MRAMGHPASRYPGAPAGHSASSSFEAPTPWQPEQRFASPKMRTRTLKSLLRYQGLYPTGSARSVAP